MAKQTTRSPDDDDKVLGAYFHDIEYSTPLSRKREVELSERIKQGDEPARNELVEANLRFVVDIAKHYQNRGLSLSELISAGNTGLITAAGRFDGARGFKFISYAVWWVKQAIMEAIAVEARTIRLSLNKLAELKKIFEARAKLRKERDQEPSLEQIAQELGVTVEEVEYVILSTRSIRSLDVAFKDEEDHNLLSILADESQPSPDSGVLLQDARAQIEKVLGILDQREQKILQLNFGLDGEKPLTLELIGAIIGLTRERVRQIKERALSKLRNPSRAELLKQASYDASELIVRRSRSSGNGFVRSKKR
ncbi:RNA polymerase sigma factor RpoD/SigA [Patescibacteria group bacterium]|nr:RNA polymerase sigma factor RpoD/SigA [Patescibacteria group bacterium]